MLSILKPYHPSLPVDPRALNKTPQTLVWFQILFLTICVFYALVFFESFLNFGGVDLSINIFMASRLCAGSVQLLSDKLLKLNNCIPVEFASKPRSVSEVDRSKATKFCQFLLYTGLVVLPGVLSHTL
jgi:hypothetical protein